MKFDQEYYSQDEAIGIMMRSYMLREAPEDLPKEVPYGYGVLTFQGRRYHVIRMESGPHTAVLSKSILGDVEDHLYPRDNCVFCGTEYPRVLGCPECGDDFEYSVYRYDPINDTFGRT